MVIQTYYKTIIWKDSHRMWKSTCITNCSIILVSG